MKKEVCIKPGCTGSIFRVYIIDDIVKLFCQKCGTKQEIDLSCCGCG